jgi:hypothetical protein
MRRRQRSTVRAVLGGGLLRLLLAVSVLITLFSGLSACAKRDVTHLAERRPTLDLEQFFEGQSVAYGIFEDRFGNLRRQFRVSLQGTVSGNRLVLDEQFLYEDGEKAQRVWTIDKLESGDDGTVRYEGQASDIEGRANGRVSGNGLNWHYDVVLNMDGRELEVHFDDWIYRQSEDVAINRAYVSKFGVKIGSVTIVFLRGKAAATIGPLNLDQWVSQ